MGEKVRIQNNMKQSMTVLVEEEGKIITKTLARKESIEVDPDRMTPDIKAKIARGYFRLW